MAKTRKHERHKLPLRLDRSGWRPNEYKELIGGCSRQTVYNYINKGILDTEKVGGMRLITTSPDELYRRMRERDGDI